MNMNVITAIRNSKGFSRTVAYLIAVALVGLLVERTIYYVMVDNDIIEAENPIDTLYRVAPHKARQLGLQRPQEPQDKSNDAKLSASILETRDTLDVLAYELHREEGEPAIAQKQLDDLYEQLKEQDKQTMADFQQTGRHIEKYQLAEIVKERHLNAVENYRNDMDILLANVQTALSAQERETKFEAVMAARKHLEGKQLQRSQQPFDPNNLPHKSMQPNPDNKPKLIPDQFSAAGLYNNPNVQYASHDNYTFGNLAGASNPAYLAETDEVKISPLVQAKADELQHDPVKIYNWVHNNIEWIPSWGAMQDSDITLGSLRGNSMDISSLLIALYRASGIPARYVHGTIEVPENKFRNWVGGFGDAKSAGEFASSGGIPIVATIKSGEIYTFRLEHIWVEIAIDYQPSRGSVNKDADSWIQLDPSYKQYEYSQGLNAHEIAGINTQQYATDFINSGVINESESWASGFDSTIVENTIQQTRDALIEHVNTNMPNATVGDVIGGRRIVRATNKTLPSTISNPIAVIGARYGKIPSTLQAKLTVTLGRDDIGLPVSEVTLPWPIINNQKLTLGFKPASVSDEEALLSYYPNGGIEDVNQLPNILPAYLINVIPELKLNGVAIATGKRMTLGEELHLEYSLSTPTDFFGKFSSPIPAGSYVALAMNSSSVSKKLLLDVKTKMDEFTSNLQSAQTQQNNLIDKDNGFGDILYAGVLGYYAQYHSLSHVQGIQQQAIQRLLPSGGTYGYIPQVDYFFGVPNTIRPGSIELDLDSTVTITAPLDGDKGKSRRLLQMTGAIGSGLEHAISEQLFSTSLQPNEGLSAVKLLHHANESGQRIYQITQQNMSTSLQYINLDESVLSEITIAISQGKEAITHTDNVSINGYTGAGYIIYDPEVGDGAYKISGGLNGGYYTLTSVAAALILGLVIGFGLLVPVYLFAMLAILFAVSLALAFYHGIDFGTYANEIEFMAAVAAGAGLFAGVGLLATALGAAAFASAAIYLFLAWIVVWGFVFLTHNIMHGARRYA